MRILDGPAVLQIMQVRCPGKLGPATGPVQLSFVALPLIIMFLKIDAIWISLHLSVRIAAWACDPLHTTAARSQGKVVSSSLTTGSHVVCIKTLATLSTEGTLCGTTRTSDHWTNSNKNQTSPIHQGYQKQSARTLTTLSINGKVNQPPDCIS